MLIIQEIWATEGRDKHGAGQSEPIASALRHAASHVRSVDLGRVEAFDAVPSDLSTISPNFFA